MANMRYKQRFFPLEKNNHASCYSIRKRRSSLGFTLIELLVVIAIIGILSSVVLASLNTARERARTSSIKTEVLEFRKIMELEYLATGSYANLNKGWVGDVGSGEPCATRGYTGAYASSAVAICEHLEELVRNSSVNGYMYTGVDPIDGYSDSSDYSIMARLPNDKFFCAGSSGRTSDTQERGPGWTWDQPGCYSNP